MNNIHFKPASQFLDKANKVFQEQKARLNKLLPFADIHHVGATSILHSLTKDDLDIVVRVPAEKFQSAIKVMKELYESNQKNNWTKNFASFKDEKNLGIDFGAQLVIANSASDDFVKLSELLKKNTKLVKEYNKMKIKFEGKMMDDYRKEKAAFFDKLRKLL